MYGKIFSTLWTGSLMGAGAVVQNLMTYACVNCDPKGFVELNPKLLAAVFGEPVADVEKSLAHLQKPDPDSRTPDEEGRRLAREGQFLYRVVNYEKYRRTYDADAKREQTRDRVRRHRQGKKDVTHVTQSALHDRYTPPESPATGVSEERDAEGTKLSLIHI